MRRFFAIKLAPEEQPPSWLIAAWEELIRSNPNIGLFQSPYWVLNYWRHRRPQKRFLHLFVAMDGARLIGLAPLVNKPRRPPFLSHWRAVHAEGEYDADWVCHPEYRNTFVRMVCDFLEAQKHHWFSYRDEAVREDSGVLDSLQSECERRGIPFRYQRVRNIPFLKTDGHEPIEQRVSRKYRQELRRRERNLGKLGAVTYVDASAVDALSLQRPLEELFRVEAAGWKGRAGSAISQDPRAETFWRAFAEETAKAKLLRLHLLRLCGNAIAGQLGAVLGDTYYSLKLGYDERFKKYGPGALITRFAIQSCIDDPAIDTYDFAGPAMPYMSNWTNLSRHAGTVILATPRRAGSALFRLNWYGRGKLKSIRELGRIARPGDSEIGGA